MNRDKYILIFLFCTICFAWTADCFGQSFADNFKNLTAKNYRQFTANSKVDTIKLDSYTILKAKATRQYKFICGADPQPCEVLQRFNEIIYLVNDSLVFYSFQDKDYKDFNANQLENIFLFPDSSLGLILFNEENIWQSTTETNFRVLNILKNNSTEVIFHFKSSDCSSLWAQINLKNIYGAIPNDNPYKDIKYIDNWDEEARPNISFSWGKVGEKLKITLNSNSEFGTTTPHQTDLYFSFFKTKNKIAFSFDKYIARK